MRQNKSYEIYTLMPGRYLPGFFLLFPGLLDHRLLRISKNVAKSRVERVTVALITQSSTSLPNRSDWRKVCRVVDGFTCTLHIKGLLTAFKFKVY